MRKSIEWIDPKIIRRYRNLWLFVLAVIAISAFPVAARASVRHKHHHRVVCYWVSEPLPPTNAFIFESAGERIPDQDITLTYWHCA